MTNGIEPRRPGARAAAAWGSVVIVPLVTLASALPARAQGVLSDSTSIHPTYRTNYRVFKTRRDWTQSMGFETRRGVASFGGSLASDANQDETQSELERAVSRSSGRIDLHVSEALRLGLTGTFNRTRQSQTTSTLRQRTEQLQLTARDQRTLFDLLRLSTDARAGIRQSLDRGVRRIGAGGLRNRTEQSGPSVSVSWDVTNPTANTDAPIAWRAGFDTDRFRQETRDLRSDLAGDLQTVVAETDTTFRTTNSSQALSAGFDWTPKTSASLTVDFRRSSSNRIRPAPRQGELERTASDELGADVSARFAPVQDLTLSVAFSAAKSELSSNLTTASNRDGTSTRLDADGSYRWQLIDFQLGLELRSERQDYRPVPGTTPQIDQETEYKRMNGRASRALFGNKITATLSVDVTLDQRFFDDGILDNDRQDRSTDLTLSYRPLAGLSGRLSITEDRQRIVNLHQSRAGNTNTQQQLSVGTGYSITIRRVRISQDLTISAQSRTFDFNDASQSDLTRSNRIVTRLDATLLPRVTMNLEHTYNFRNSGRFARDPDGVRRFSLSREFIEQQVRAGTEYKPAPWLTLRSLEVFRVVENRTPTDASERRDRTNRFELELAARLNRELVGGVDARLDVTRVLSSIEDFFWRVDVSANRRF